MSAAPPPSAPEPRPAAAADGEDRNTSEAASPTAAAVEAAPAGSGFVPGSTASTAAADLQTPESSGSQRARKGPLSFLSGALTSLLLAWLSLGLSQKVVAYYAEHPPHYSAQIAQSIATALKTLIVGMCFLATFSFAFIGLGLTLTFVRSLLPGSRAERAS
jgi:hypothetical protein